MYIIIDQKSRPYHDMSLQGQRNVADHPATTHHFAATAKRQAEFLQRQGGDAVQMEVMAVEPLERPYQMMTLVVRIPDRRRGREGEMTVECISIMVAGELTNKNVEHLLDVLEKTHGHVEVVGVSQVMDFIMPHQNESVYAVPALVRYPTDYPRLDGTHEGDQTLADFLHAE